MTIHKTFIKTHIVQQTKHPLGYNINRQVSFWTKSNCLGIFNSDNKSQVDEMNKKNWKFLKTLKINNIINFKTVRYKKKAMSNIIHSTLN